MATKQVKNFLKRIREEKNLTQDQLVEFSGVSRYIISEFENEKRRPSPRTISRIAEALGCSYITLMTGKEDIEYDKKNLIAKNLKKYLTEAINLTKNYCGNKKIDQDLMMKISGYLSHLIEEYERSDSHKRKKIIAEIEEQKAQFFAIEIFLERLNKNKHA
jgi:transcriptional regulator with XRE-family HTH domain